MKIVQDPIYRCDICGAESKWIKGEWITHVFPIKHDEYEFHLCSDNCDGKLLEMTKLQKVELYNSIRGKTNKIKYEEK